MIGTVKVIVLIAMFFQYRLHLFYSKRATQETEYELTLPGIFKVYMEY